MENKTVQNTDYKEMYVNLYHFVDIVALVDIFQVFHH